MTSGAYNLNINDAKTMFCNNVKMNKLWRSHLDFDQALRRMFKIVFKALCLFPLQKCKFILYT